MNNHQTTRRAHLLPLMLLLALALGSVLVRHTTVHAATATSGTVWAWGQNNSGKLGNGSTTDSNIPVQVSGLSGVTAVASGSSHGLAVTSSGTAWAWGYNSDGQLGNGTITTDSHVPVQVSGLSGVVAVAGGGEHSLALKSDGTVWAWGNNAYGQLGKGTQGDNSNGPVQVSGLSGVIAVAGGYFHSLAVKSDGTVWAWGYNGLGELGNGTMADSYVPVQVSGLSGVIAVSGGYDYSLALAGASDTIAPTASPIISTGTRGANGWYTSDVTVTWNWSDNAEGTGIDPAKCTTSTKSAAEGVQTLTATCADQAGNVGTASLVVQVDKTPPSVVYTGNAGTYAVNQTLAITCTARDTVSGVASSTCQDITGPAYSFSVGSNTVSASATDWAGNTGIGSTSFTVQVTVGSLCTVTKEFIQGSARYQALPPSTRTWIDQQATALCRYLTTAQFALTPAQKTAAIAFYQRAAAALVPLGWLTQTQADILTRLSTGL